jgi:hypothetical protein
MATAMIALWPPIGRRSTAMDLVVTSLFCAFFQVSPCRSMLPVLRAVRQLLPDDSVVALRMLYSGRRSEMADHANPAPPETAVVIEAIKSALATIPKVRRKAALKHASEAVWAELIDQSEHAKVASREAPSEPGAKAAAATAVIHDLAEAAGPDERVSGQDKQP